MARSLPKVLNPAAYEDWYHTPRGAWIGDTEFRLLMKMLKPVQGGTLLDIGCGSGYFSRRFANKGLAVIGIDPDNTMLAYAQSLNRDICYIQGNALSMPFADNSVDYCAAVTSLCFVENPKQGIHEMLRVSRRGTIIGLLNGKSRLYRQKYDRGAYRGARWDTADNVNNWLTDISSDINVEYRSAVFFPSGNMLARITEGLLTHRLCWGSFLVVALNFRE